MVDETIPTVQFDNKGLELNDRFDAWRDAIAPVFDVEPIEVSDGRSPAGFASRIEGYHLGNMLAASVHTGAQRFYRARHNHRVDHLLVQVHRKGGYQGRLDESTVKVPPHHVSLIDLDRPLHTESGETDILNVVLPRELFGGQTAFLDGLHGLVLEPNRGAFLADYLAALMRRLPSVKTHEAPELTRITRDMVLACCADDAEARARIQPSIRVIMRRRLEGLIEKELASPRLTPDALCRTAGMSRTQLYRQFEPDGGVVRYIQRRRLARVKQYLDDPREFRSIGQLAELLGFHSQAHFSRCFRERYGCSPREARELAKTLTMTSKIDAGNTVNNWVCCLKRR